MGHGKAVGLAMACNLTFRLLVSVDGWGFLTHPFDFPGCIAKAILLDNVFAYICVTRSDWPDGSVAARKVEKF